jgi:nicotinamide-nucleotide amidase
MGRESLEEVVGISLKRRGETVSTAESCTGGLIAERLTRVPGSSAYVMEGRVTYANEAKRRLLGVPAGIFGKTGPGAVSRDCAEAMARGLREKAKTDWAVAVTGIAGPDGGSPEKPVGLVFIALAGPKGVRAWEHRFPGPRARVREWSALWALEHLRRALGK